MLLRACACVQDYEHKGVSNIFLANHEHELAIRYAPINPRS